MGQGTDDRARTTQAALGCTVGVARIPGGFLFFKNRDLLREYREHRILVFESTPESYSLRGINLKTRELEGVSIGVNRHRVCVASTHVQSSNDMSYDLLCERLLHGVRQPEDVHPVLDRFLPQGPVQGGRILVALPRTAFLIEVFQDESRIEQIESSFAMTNSFSLIDYRPERPEILDRSSDNRLDVATRWIAKIEHVGDLKSMLRSHVPQKGPVSICTHDPGEIGTESSHIVEVHGSLVTWSSLAGAPCENDYNAVQLFR
jgi:hypothetical protein